jgi:hypothetical protein
MPNDNLDISDDIRALERKHKCLCIVIEPADFEFVDEDHGLTEAEMADAMLSVYDGMCSNLGDFITEAIANAKALRNRRKSK